MKDLKKKLTAAGAMLVVSAVMLSGVSYAWFTLSTNPEVSNIKANIAANENLEIALDNGYATGEKPATGDDNSVDKASIYADSAQGSKTGNPYTWGNLVDLDKAMKTLNPEQTGKKLVLAPVKYDNKSLLYPEYGEDGRIAEVTKGLTSTNILDLDTNNAFGIKNAAGGVKGYSKDEATYDAFSVDFWLRSNENCGVSLTGTSKTKRAHSQNDTNTQNDVNTVEGNGSYITIDVSGENDETTIMNYVKNLVVRFDCDNNSYYAKLSKDSLTNNKLKLALKLDSHKNSETTTDTTAPTISLNKNVAKKITMWVYVDGETVTNASSLLDDASMEMNIQFSSNEIDGNGETPGAMNGATATTSNGN